VRRSGLDSTDWSRIYISVAGFRELMIPRKSGNFLNNCLINSERVVLVVVLVLVVLAVLVMLVVVMKVVLILAVLL
jgi:hypothetical protein